MLYFNHCCELKILVNHFCILKIQNGKLTPAQKSTVTKSSTERLRLYLMRSGYAEEVVLAWSRDELMDKYAELLVQGVEPAVVRSVYPELEKARMVQEKELREKELAAEATQREMQRELKVAKLKADAAQRELLERVELEKISS